MMTSEWSLPAAIDAVTAAVPDREMLVWTSVRRTYAEVQERTQRLGAFFAAHGLGVRRERSDARRGGSAGRAPSRSCCRTAPSTSRRCSARFAPGRCRSTSTTTTTRPRSRSSSTRSVPRRSSTTAGSHRCSRMRVRRTAGSSSTSTTAPKRAPLPGSIAFEVGDRERRRCRRAPDAVARRPLSRVHRRHHRSPEGCDVATGRRLRRGDGRGRGRDGRRRSPRRRGSRRRSGSPRRRSCTAPRSGRCSPRCTTAGPSCSTTTPSPFDARAILETVRARAASRCSPSSAMRTRDRSSTRCATRTLRPLVVAAALDRRRDDTARTSSTRCSNCCPT